MSLKNVIKVIIAGLDFAGKTSILTALDQKFDFEKEILELKPTIKVEYSTTTFLGNRVFYWDMGGQQSYREMYQKRQDVYFSGTDLFVYIIDIQDKDRFEDSLKFLSVILDYFKSNDMDVPLIVSFHKFDPELRDNAELIERMSKYRERILNKYPTFKILFQQTSIYDIISIVQLISYGLSVFDDQFFALSTLLEDYLDIFDCTSLILFDQNGIIISEFYTDDLSTEIYIELLESIKEHLFLLKRMQEEHFESDYNFFEISENKLLSYFHRITYGKYSYYISVLIEEKLQEKLIEKFPDFADDVLALFNKLFS